MNFSMLLFTWSWANIWKLLSFIKTQGKTTIHRNSEMWPSQYYNLFNIPNNQCAILWACGEHATIGRESQKPNVITVICEHLHSLAWKLIPENILSFVYKDIWYNCVLNVRTSATCDHMAEKLRFCADILHNVTLCSYEYFKASTVENVNMLQKSPDSSSENKRTTDRWGTQVFNMCLQKCNGFLCVNNGISKIYKLLLFCIKWKYEGNEITIINLPNLILHLISFTAFFYWCLQTEMSLCVK